MYSHSFSLDYPLDITIVYKIVYWIRIFYEAYAFSIEPQNFFALILYLKTFNIKYLYIY